MNLDKLDRVPPFAVRLMAVKNHGYSPLSNAELAKKSGLSKSAIEKISKAKSWATWPIGIAIKFADACGFDFERPSEFRKWLRRSKMAHVKYATAQQRKFLTALMRG